jgi:hypothetical protein
MLVRSRVHPFLIKRRSCETILTLSSMGPVGVCRKAEDALIRVVWVSREAICLCCWLVYAHPLALVADAADAVAVADAAAAAAVTAGALWLLLLLPPSSLDGCTPSHCC